MSDFIPFDEYYVRPVGERDREYLEDLIEGDQWHKDKMTADDFLSLMPGEQAFVVENEQGFALLYFKTQTAVRLTLQFVETRNAADRARNRNILLKGIGWLEERLRGRFREIITETDGSALTMMVKKRMGFQELPNQLSRLIPQVPTNESAKGLWHGVPQPNEVGEG